MTEWRLVKLNFGRSPAHFGEVGIGLEETSERVRSDTLFSAWVTSYARLFGGEEVAVLLNSFPIDREGHRENTAPFSISSTFIYQVTNGRETYYLPRPVGFPQGYPKDDLKISKPFKKLKFLPLKIWQRWYQGDGFTDDDRDQLIAKTKKDETGFKDKQLEKAGTFAYQKAFEISKVPKVAIDRTTRATNFYHTGFVQFRWKQEHHSGLYFILKMYKNDSDLENKLKASLNLLGEEGLGGERSSGAGRFEVVWSSLPREWEKVINPKRINTQGDQHSLISAFWDAPLDESLFICTNYELQKRGGWITSPFSGQQRRRKSIQMFMEGSVFSTIPTGKLADVTPGGFSPHPIYRSGIAMSLPINSEAEP